jgi:hypothetical protein
MNCLIYLFKNIEKCGLALLLPRNQKENQEYKKKKSSNVSEANTVPLALNNSLFSLPDSVKSETKCSNRQ